MFKAVHWSQESRVQLGPVQLGYFDTIVTQDKSQITLHVRLPALFGTSSQEQYTLRGIQSHEDIENIIVEVHYG